MRTVYGFKDDTGLEIRHGERIFRVRGEITADVKYGLAEDNNAGCFYKEVQSIDLADIKINSDESLNESEREDYEEFITDELVRSIEGEVVER